MKLKKQKVFIVSMFQKSVLKTVSQDESLVALRWAKFQEYKDKIDFIKTAKEEKFQDTFLKDIFENCLGYTLDTTNPNDFNLEREKKNETDGGKADGVIYVDNKIIGVIELKGQDTKNLDKVQSQAFEYHNKHNSSKYIIISNFDEFRFYIDKQTEYETFNLFTLTFEEFKKFHLILSYESIKKDIPQQLKNKSTSFEQDISKKLYKDFSLFRTHLFENLVKNNNNLDKALLLRLTQKLCDRIIFILFAEDRGLLTANTIREIREEFGNQKFTDYKLYDIYKFYFNAINTGNSKLNIPKYNGGLFAEDNTLDSLIIDDNILDVETQALSDYDFMSDIGVNILGHIFEQSLTDLEEINATINDVDFDHTQTKRKKDGVFYTPEYITKYIVDNTLGKLCNDKRDELKISELTAPKNPKKPTKKEQQQKNNLIDYREWLLDLKIIDPACGSGAFLNQALDYLIKEHKALQKDLVVMGDITAYYEIEKSILENNLYGVDINEDAVEIAKLSLWLRTATKGRELTKLADKILCANSLLDMPFEYNTFDIVIGNPPYVRQEMIKELKPQLQDNYEVYTGTADLFVYFYELSYKLLKPNGVNGFICSNKFFRAKYGQKLRELILNKTTIKSIVDFSDVKIFEDATVDSTITVLQKGFVKNNIFEVSLNSLDNFFDMAQSDLTKDSFSFANPEELAIKKKIVKVGTPLKEWDIKINYGIKTGFNEAFIIDGAKKDELIAKDKNNTDMIKPLLRGRDIKKYSCDFADKWILITFPALNINIDNYPVIKEYLSSFGEILEQTGKKGSRKKTNNKWFETQDQIAYYDEFEKEKLFYNEIGNSLEFYLDKNKFYCNNKLYFITSNELNLAYLIAILNSTTLQYYFQMIFNFGGGKGKDTFQHIPIPKIDTEQQQPFINLANEILESNQKIKDYKILLEETVNSNNFDREIKLKKDIETFENTVITNEQQIDKMVYNIYNITTDEIKIIEEI